MWRAADAELLHFLDQAGFGIAWRGLGEVLVRGDLATGEGIALRHGGEHAAGFVVLVLVRAFLVEFEEAVKGDDGAVGAEFGTGVRDIHGDLVQFGGLHLAGDGALPDQLVEAGLFGVQVGGDLVRGAGHVRWAAGFVGFLGVLGFACVFAGGDGDVGVAVFLAQEAADAVDGFAGHLHAVRPHVGDQADGFAAEFDTFIELLRGAHGGLRAHAEFAAGFLLERGGGEGGGRIALDAAALDGGDGEGAGLHGGLGARGFLGIVEIELVQLLAVQVGQLGGEGGAGGGEEMALHGPILAGTEGFDLRLT